MVLRTHRAWEGHNSLDTYLNGENEVSISIYMKNKCQWSSFFDEIKVWKTKLCCFEASKVYRECFNG